MGVQVVSTCITLPCLRQLTQQQLIRMTPVCVAVTSVAARGRALDRLSVIICVIATIRTERSDGVMDIVSVLARPLDAINFLPRLATVAVIAPRLRMTIPK